MGGPRGSCLLDSLLLLTRLLAWMLDLLLLLTRLLAWMLDWLLALLEGPQREGWW